MISISFPVCSWSHPLSLVNMIISTYIHTYIHAHLLLINVLLPPCSSIIYDTSIHVVACVAMGTHISSFQSVFVDFVSILLIFII